MSGFCPFALLAQFNHKIPLIHKYITKTIIFQAFKCNFYYRLISKIFYDLITSNEYIILDALRKVGYINPDPKLLLDDALKNPKNLANLCNVTCISDNILIIKL